MDTEKRKELLKAVEIIKANAEVEKVILFGSFARGDWVSDRYREGHIIYEYQSDFDLLVVVKTVQIEKNYSLWNLVEEKIREDKEIKTPVSLLVDTIRFVNGKLKEGNYFYADIANEGILLFDSGKYKFAKPSSLSIVQRRELARKDFDFWFGKAESFLKDYSHNISDKSFSNAAFHLNQAVEALLTSVLLVYTGYKPKTHNIEKILSLVLGIEKELAGVFKRETREEKRLFELLKRSYIDARYSKDFKISEEDLKRIHSQTTALKEEATRVCEERIKGMI